MKFDAKMDISTIPSRLRADGFIITCIPAGVLFLTLAPGREILGACLCDVATAEAIAGDLQKAIQRAKTGGN